MKRSLGSLLTVLLLVPGLLAVACSDDDDPYVPPTTVTSYDQMDGWVCNSGESCQDVFNIQFAAGSTVTFQVTDITGSSIAQVALYAPGVALGGTNLFTGTTNELRCNYVDGCDTLPDGQTVAGFAIATAGVYRLAITRDWAESCSSTGGYRLIIDSDKKFHLPTRTVNNVATLAPGTECP